MNKSFFGWKRLAALLLCILMMVSSLPALAASTTGLTITFTGTVYADRARTCLNQLNKLRKANGLSELTMLADLEKVAIQRAAELFVFFDHDRPNLTSYASAYKEYPSLGQCSTVSENIAAGFPYAANVMEEWRNDPELLDNMLYADFTHVGIACVSVQGSYNGTYWVMYLQQQPEGLSAPQAKATASSAKRTFTVDIKKGMFSRVDKSHGAFKLKVNNVNMKTKKNADINVYLYDKYDVKIGKVNPSDLSYTSSNTKVVTVLKNGSLSRKSAGTSTITVKAAGLDAVKCTVTTTGSSASNSGKPSGGVTAATIGSATPSFSATAYVGHVTLSTYLKGASGYVLYRSTSKNGSYRKVDEQATTQRWSLKIEKADKTQTYYYKIRAYKNSNGSKVYSEYSAPVKVVH